MLKYELADLFRRVAFKQSRAILECASSLDEEAFFQAVQVLKKARIIYTVGVGKSAYIAGKVADSLTSVGSPAIFLRADQFLHGGMSILQEDTCLLLISKSGKTQELLDIATVMMYTCTTVPKVLITSQSTSTLAQLSDVILSYSGEECCGTNFVPTTSTTLSLVIGDALTMALMNENAYTVQQFAASHPGGSLGNLVRNSIGQVEFPYGEHYWQNSRDEDTGRPDKGTSSS